MDFKKDNDEFDWKKDNFDFDLFLGDDSLDDRVTAAVDGQDLLDPDSLGVSADYIPRRTGESEKGRHEAPEEEGRQNWEFDPVDPRYAAPERPRVVVSEPRKNVYVTPDGRGGGSGGIRQPPPQNPGGGSRGMKWAIAILAVLVVVGVILLVSLINGRRSSDNARETTSPAITETPAATGTAAPTDTPAPTEREKDRWMITVTAGSGGSVTPGGIVAVNDGDDAAFAIVPGSGYVLRQLLIDGSSVPLADNYTFRNVKENHTLYAIFESTATPTPAPTATPSPTPTEAPTPTPAPTPEPTPVPTDPPQQLPIEDIPGGWDDN